MKLSQWLLVSFISSCLIFLSLQLISKHRKYLEKDITIHHTRVISKTKNKAVIWDKNILACVNVHVLFDIFRYIQYTLYPFHIWQGVLWLCFFFWLALLVSLLFLSVYQMLWEVKAPKVSNRNSQPKIKLHKIWQTQRIAGQSFWVPLFSYNLHIWLPF